MNAEGDGRGGLLSCWWGVGGRRSGGVCGLCGVRLLGWRLRIQFGVLGCRLSVVVVGGFLGEVWLLGRMEVGFWEALFWKGRVVLR